MKLLDIGKCHVDSPDFKADLATLEVRVRVHASHHSSIFQTFNLQVFLISLQRCLLVSTEGCGCEAENITNLCKL